MRVTSKVASLHLYLIQSALVIFLVLGRLFHQCRGAPPPRLLASGLGFASPCARAEGSGSLAGPRFSLGPLYGPLGPGSRQMFRLPLAI